MIFIYCGVRHPTSEEKDREVKMDKTVVSEEKSIFSCKLVSEEKSLLSCKSI